MTLSGSLEAYAKNETPEVLIPLLVDDPLRVFAAYVQKETDKACLNPSFSG